MKRRWDLLCGKYIYYILLCFFLLLLYGLPYHCIDVPTKYWVSKLTHNHALLEHFEWNRMEQSMEYFWFAEWMFTDVCYGEKDMVSIWWKTFCNFSMPNTFYTQMNHFQKLNKTENLMSKSKPYIELISNATGWLSQDYFKCKNTRAVDKINERFSKLKLN